MLTPSPHPEQRFRILPSFVYDENTPLTENPAQDILDLRNYLWTLRASPPRQRASAESARPRPPASR